LCAAGGGRIFAPELEITGRMPEAVAWVCVASGLACLALFGKYFLRHMRARHAAG
jgi:hypothetical protein